MGHYAAEVTDPSESRRALEAFKEECRNAIRENTYVPEIGDTVLVLWDGDSLDWYDREISRDMPIRRIKYENGKTLVSFMTEKEGEQFREKERRIGIAASLHGESEWIDAKNFKKKPAAVAAA